ncbi:MAG: hypothetical protein ACRYGG_22185, partial [Janthinobacterium lividum]
MSPTALTYVKQGRRIHGVFAGVHVEKGMHLVKTLVQANEAGRSGRLTHFLGESDAMHIQIDEERTPTIGRQINGRALISHGDFISHFYTHDDLHMMRLAALVEVTIVGRINNAHEEASGLRCGIVDHGSFVSQGCLNDILQIDRFLGEGTTPRTRLLSTVGDPEPPSPSKQPGLVVLDGSDAVVKWSSHFPHSHLLAIMDRTEPQYLEALSQVNARFLARASDYEWP